MIDPQALFARIGKAVKELGQATERYKAAVAEARVKGIECADAKALYEKVRFTAQLTSEHTTGEDRKAAGRLAAVDALKDWGRKETLYDSAKEHCWLAKHEVENARAILSAVQTASALVRAESEAMKHQT